MDTSFWVAFVSSASVQAWPPSCPFPVLTIGSFYAFVHSVYARTDVSSAAANTLTSREAKLRKPDRYRPASPPTHHLCKDALAPRDTDSVLRIGGCLPPLHTCGPPGRGREAWMKIDAGSFIWCSGAGLFNFATTQMSVLRGDVNVREDNSVFGLTSGTYESHSLCLLIFVFLSWMGSFRAGKFRRKVHIC